MNAADASMRICVACNEDGLGPSAFAYYVVRCLIDNWKNPGPSLNISVLNHSAVDFNRKLYQGLPVQVVPIDSLVRFEKANGEVHVPRTLKRLQQYVARRESYANEARDLLNGCAVAIDIGVPLLSYSAAQCQVPHRLTLFDHSWAATLRLMAADKWKSIYTHNPPPSPADISRAERITVAIEEDEACATDVVLFEPYLTPSEFLTHWQRLGFAPKILPGVLGARASHSDARAKLNTTLAEYGDQRPAPPDKPWVLLSPGGTPVWDQQLLTLLDQVLDAAQLDYVLVLSKDLAQLPHRRADLLERIYRSDRIRYFGPLAGTTQQAVLPAFRRIVTRAGGGTINDALAAGVEFVFIEEAQVQVKLIERQCVSLGLSAPPATLDEFRQNPKSCIDRLVAMPLPKAQVTPPRGAERMVVEQILSWIA